MSCNISFIQSVLQCCSADDFPITHELKLDDTKLPTPKESSRKLVALSCVATDLNSQLAVSEYDPNVLLSERNRSCVHEILQHICSESSTSFGESLLSFKNAIRHQAALFPV
jgi:hypothetical protein